MTNRGHRLGEGVILCHESVHAAVNKGGEAYGVNVEMLPVDEDDEVIPDAPDLSKGSSAEGTDSSSDDSTGAESSDAIEMQGK